MFVFESWLGGMATVVLLGGTLVCGLLVIPRELARPAVRALAGMPLTALGAAGLGIALYLVGGTVAWGLGTWFTLSLGMIGFAVYKKLYQELLEARELRLLLGVLAVGFFLAWFGWGEARDGTIRAMHGTWGDGPLHVLVSEAFTHRMGPNFEHPLFAGEQIREPFGYDFLASMLRKGGLSLGGAFSLPAAGLLACLMAWSGHLAAQLVPKEQRRSAAILAAVGVIAFGGLQWLDMATRTNAWSPGKFFGPHELFWEKQENLGLVWENHLVLFSSQKHLLLASAFLVVLAGMLLSVVRKKSEKEKYPFLLSPFSFVMLAVATGLLPLVHMHAFIAAGLLWITYAAMTRTRQAVFLGVGALIVAVPTVVWFSGLFGRSGFLTVVPGWMAEGHVGAWLRLWAVNLGVFLPLAVLSAWRIRKKQPQSLFLLGFPAATLFLLANVVQFQPYRWDNIKVFLFAWLLAAPLVWAELVGLRSRIATSILISFMFLTFLSGLSSHAVFRFSHAVYTPEVRAAGKRLEALLPSNAVVLSSADTQHNHPVTLTGRTLLSGYAGWVWTRNYPWAEREHILQQLRLGGNDVFCPLASQLGLTHMIEGEEHIRSVQERCTVP